MDSEIVQEIPMKEESPSLEIWILCPNCARRLAKKIGPGRYETVMVQRRGKEKKILRVVIISGEITCPNTYCGETVHSTMFHRNEHELGGLENARTR